MLVAVLAFPSNEFGGQEPGTNQEVCSFAASRGAKFPVFGKIKVNGSDADPLYKWLKAEGKEAGLMSLMGNEIKWNFGAASLYF